MCGADTFHRLIVAKLTYSYIKVRTMSVEWVIHCILHVHEVQCAQLAVHALSHSSCSPSRHIKHDGIRVLAR